MFLPLPASLPTVAMTTDIDVTVDATGVPDPPFYNEAAFIIGMVILGVVILFVISAVILCCVRPRGNTKFPTRTATFNRNSSIAKRYSSASNWSNRYSKMGSPGSPDHGRSTGRWKPGDIQQVRRVCVCAVSYTHLTLPTIYSV